MIGSVMSPRVGPDVDDDDLQELHGGEPVRGEDGSQAL